MITVVTVAVIASLTLLPAVLSLMGDRVDRFRVPLVHRRRASSADRQGGFWDRITYTVMRRPVISLVLAGGLLAVAAVPYFDINTGTSGVSELPDDFRVKQGFEVLCAEFGFGLNAPAEIVIDADIGSDAVQEAIAELTTSLESDSGFGPSTLEGNGARDLALLSAPLLAGPATEECIDSIRTLRDEHIPQAFSEVTADVLVTATTAVEIDGIDLGRRYLPIVITLVLALSFILLTLVFRSIVVPAKAIIMNLLSVGAAYGILSWSGRKGLATRFSVSRRWT